MEFNNKTKEKVIKKEVIIANSFFTRLKGLLGKKRLSEEQCILIRPCKSVHTFFMKFPIDVIFIDKNFKVVKVIKNITPGHITTYVKEAWSVIEMAVDKEVDSKFMVGDELYLSKACKDPNCSCNKANIKK